MDTVNAAPKSQHLKVGGPLKVLLVLENAQLLKRMDEVVRALPGLHLAGSFTTTSEAVDWLVWDRQGWHLAFVDLGLRDDGGKELMKYLLRQPRAGQVVAVGDHLWREIRAGCAAIGVYELLEKGDLIAFQSFLESRLQ